MAFESENQAGRSMSNTSSKGAALITGASRGIGAVYADRLARRGHDLILVARSEEPLKALAATLSSASGRQIIPIVADLNNETGLAKVETKLKDDPAPVEALDYDFNLSKLERVMSGAGKVAALGHELERRGRITDVEFSVCAGNRLRLFYCLVCPLQHCAGFGQENAPCLGQAHRFGGAL